VVHGSFLSRWGIFNCVHHSEKIREGNNAPNKGSAASILGALKESGAAARFLL